MQRIVDRLPQQVRLLVLASLFGVAGGVASVAFTLATNKLFDAVWPRLAAAGTTVFLVGSFATLVLSSLAAGLLMTRVCPAAAGSGVPQLKAAYWIDLGVVPLRAVIVKFVGGVLTLAGGSSLGREGPTVFLSGGLCSNLAGWLGIDRRHRRHAAATGAAAGLAAAFNTPLAGVSFVLEEILGDLGSRVVGSVVLAAGGQPQVEPPVVFRSRQTLDEIDPLLVRANVGLFAVTGDDGGPLIGIFTLHDLLRAQAAVME